MELSQKASKARPVNKDSIPTHLKCHGCSQPLINCSQTLHGCRLCQRCVDTHRFCPCSRRNGRNEKDRELPERHPTGFTCTPDLGTRRELLQLAVHCPNAESGCRKQLTWRQVQLHLDNECEFNLVKCEHCSKDVVKYKLKQDGSHRNLQSADCCSELRAPCPMCGDASKMLHRLEFTEHLKTCPERRSECKYRGVGCQATLRKSQLDEHYRLGADQHIELTVKRLQRLMELKDAELRDLQQGKMDLLTRQEMKDAELLDLRQDVKVLLAIQEKKDAELRSVKQRLEIVTSAVLEFQKRLELKDAELLDVKQRLDEIQLASQQGLKDLKARPNEAMRRKKCRRSGFKGCRKRLR